MISYLLHVSLLISGCYVLYRLLLANETFYHLNRWMLLVCLIGAFGLPLIEVPAEWSLGDSFSIIESSLTTSDLTQETNMPSPVGLEVPDPGNLPLRNSPVDEESQAGVVSTSVVPLIQELPPPPAPLLSAQKSLFWSQLEALFHSVKPILWVYFLGVLIFGYRWLIQFASLIVLLFNHSHHKDGPYRLIATQKDLAPFSFLNFIVINPRKYSPETYRHILQHEKIHVLQWHSFDMILVELLVVILWFLPFAWLYRKSVRHNLEYLTDATMLKQGTSAESYQWNLLKVAAPSASNILITNYSHSFLKQRITMMNAQQSPLMARWKYAMILLFVGTSVLSLNAVIPADPMDICPPYDISPAAVSETLPTLPTSLEAAPSPETPKTMVSIPETPSDESVPSAGESHSPTDEIEGIWEANIRGDQICLKLSKDSFWDQWRMDNCFHRQEFSHLPRDNQQEFFLTNDLGQLRLTGFFSASQGSGSFVFEANQRFNQTMEQKAGISFSEKDMFHLFMAEASQSLMSELLLNPYAPLSKEQCIRVVLNGQGQEAIRLTETLSKARFTSFSSDQIVKAATHGQASELGQLVQFVHQMGREDFDAEQLLRASMHGQAYALRQLLDDINQFPDLQFSSEQLLKACMHGQGDALGSLAHKLNTYSYVRFDAEQMLKACMHGQGQTLGYLVKELQPLRHLDFDADQLLKACMHGQGQTLGTLANKLDTYTYVQFDSDEMLKACMHGQAHELGNLVETLSQVDVQFSSDAMLKACMHGQARSVADMALASQKFKDIRFTQEQILSACLHGQDREVIELAAALQSAGNTSYDAEEIINICRRGEGEAVKDKLTQSQVY